MGLETTQDLEAETARTQPWLISVDDHVTEPPDLWTSRLSEKFRDRGPQVRRGRIKPSDDPLAGKTQFEVPDGQIGDYWVFDGKPKGGLTAITHAVGIDSNRITNAPMTYEQVNPGAWQQAVRLADMDSNRIEASLCFDNTVTGYCGQTFLNNPDKELGFACIQAYNDWMIDEWCAGDGYGRLIPLILVPLWDPRLAAAEVHRCAAKSPAISASFCENPYELGLPSIYTEHWEPFFEACAETRTTISMHIGSSGKIPRTSPDSPYMMTSILMFVDSMTATLDYILAGVFERHPALKIALSEGQIGWLPYAVRRADRVWAARDKEAMGYKRTPRPPSEYVKGHVYGCIFDDDTALLCRDLIGMGQIMMEVDYPHSACHFPNVVQVANELADTAGLNQAERLMLFRGNAIEAYGLERLGIR
ncbi:MAG TPA: amidohydrolase family protein [Novosphingobium sp.]|nr:amidohydrolase family protein [Novosphingobium sp.]